MPKRDICFERDGIYHLYNRGAGKQTIFRKPAGYHYVLNKLEEYVEPLEYSMIAYCLLPNHYHFAVRQDSEVEASELPKRLFGGYSLAMSMRYGWSGTKFEGRFKGKHANTDEYLRNLCRYIHLNPVNHGLVKEPENWFYSNYHEWINPQTEDMVVREFRRRLFGSVDRYKAFLQEPRYPDWFPFPDY